MIRTQTNWLFIDLNSYFASVEQEVRPELRGRPIGIVPVVETTCCIRASYQAKAYKVKTGTSVTEARTFCPHMRLEDVVGAFDQQTSKVCVAGPAENRRFLLTKVLLRHYYSVSKTLVRCSPCFSPT